MGKNSNFARNPRDYYPTPYDPVEALLPHLQPRTRFAEPCAGDGRLACHLIENGHILQWAADIEPQARGIVQRCALTEALPQADMIITNPVWDRPLLHAMISRFAFHAPTWILLDADYMHTIQAKPFMAACRKIVSVGRVKWFLASEDSGKDNAAWYYFDIRTDGPIVFYPRT